MSKKTETKKITSIGGSALIEGIMMRGPKRTTVAVRTGADSIYTEAFKVLHIPLYDRAMVKPHPRDFVVIDGKRRIVVDAKIRERRCNGYDKHPSLVVDLPEREYKTGFAISQEFLPLQHSLRYANLVNKHLAVIASDIHEH